MIKSIRIQGFKSLDDLTLELDALNVLVGANDAGKTSVLQAIHFFVSLIQTRRLVDANLGGTAVLTTPELIYTPVHDLAGLFSLRSPEQRPGASVALDLQVGAASLQAVLTFRLGPYRTLITHLDNDAVGTKLQTLDKPYSVFVPGLSGLANAEREIAFGHLRRSVARGDSNMVLRNVLHHLAHDPTAWKRFIGLLHQVFPDVDVEWTFDEDTDEHIRIDVGSGGRRLPLDACGTGLLQAIQISSYIALFEPTVLLLDEPDSHLHPNNQKLLMRLLGAISEEGSTQIILSTHSRHIVDMARFGGKLIWLSHGRIVSDVDSGLTARLMELGALDSVDHFVNGSLKCVVATEDSGGELLEPLLWSSGFARDETTVLSYSGSSKVEAAIVLARFLDTKAPNVKLLVHRDRDYLTNEEVEDYRQRLSEAGVATFITEPTDIDGYYLKAELLADLNPALTAEKASQVLASALAEVKEKSIEKMINFRMERAFLRRKKDNSEINYGKISKDCREEYEANELMRVRGKACLKRVRALLNSEIRKHATITAVSPHLENAELKAFAQTLWP